VEIPTLPERTGYAFEEVARRHGDFALLGIAAGVTVDETGVCRDARITVVNPGAGAERMQRAASSLVGRTVDDDAARAAGEIAAADITATGDVHASPAYRRQLARVLTRRTLLRAFDRAARAR
jgi:CO/xanthine dehydrogenase FAD-binding subunit